MTQDIDIVVDNQVLANQLETFLRLLDKGDFLFDPPSVRRAVERHEMFQLLDKVEALKLDIYPRELIAGELDRSCMIEVFSGVRLPVVSRVDSAGAKLIWIDKGSHKSRRDLRQIHRTSSEADRQQIRKLASEMNLLSLLNEVLGESEVLS